MSTSSTNNESETFAEGARRLCADGTCIGLLDDGNRCKVCGLLDASAGDHNDNGDRGEDDAGRKSARMTAQLPTAEGLESVDGDAFDPARALCPDGACVGVIGAGGRCKVCGRNKEA